MISALALAVVAWLAQRLEGTTIELRFVAAMRVDVVHRVGRSHETSPHTGLAQRFAIELIQSDRLPSRGVIEGAPWLGAPALDIVRAAVNDASVEGRDRTRWAQ
jgi:hypothetical protein